MHHDHVIVLFSIILAFFASAIALELISQFSNVQSGRRSWLFLGAFTLGGGIWAMHFVGMMALHLDIPIGYEFWTTLVSFLVALLFVWAALALVCRCQRSKGVAAAIGLFLGLGIAAMHYIGMAAIRAEVSIAYKPGLFTLSIIIALGAAIFAVWISGGLAASGGDNAALIKLISILAMTAAIPGMHYTGMAATVFTPAPGLHDPSDYMGAKQLMFPITLFSLFIFGVSYSVSVYHKAQTDSLKRKHDRMEEAYLFLSQLMASLPAPIFFRDREGRYIAVNAPFRALFGLREEQIEGKYASQLSGLPNWEPLSNLDSMATRALEGENTSGSFEVSVTRPDGAQRDFMAVVSSFYSGDGQAAGSSGALTDLTEMKLIHRQVIQARDEARQATKLKDQFVSLVSHDLRSPLAAIKTMSSLLATPALREEQRVDIIRRLGLVTDGMVSLIDQLLDVSKLQTGAVTLEKKLVHLRPMVEGIIENIRPQAEGKNVAIFNDVPDSNQIFVDRTLFGEVVANILSNAVKFSRNGDKIKLFSPEDGKVALAIRDTGVGMSQEKIADLFKKEVKTSTPGTAGEKGTGLGLPFCMDIMKLHDGSIEVESTVGQGSTFHLALPPARPMILIVDDQPAQREITKKVISGAFEVDYLEASNGQEALKIMENVKPNLIISDIQMPLLDGFGLLTNVRLKGELKDIPMIIATSSASSSNPGEIDLRNRAFDLGADDYVTKPVNKVDLLPRLQKLLGR